MTDPYRQLADELVAQPFALAQLGDWFNSEKPKSSFEFGKALGQSDQHAQLIETIRSWISQGQCQELVAGYLIGTQDELTGLATVSQDQLDEEASRHPEYIAGLTVQSDIGPIGLRRVLNLFSNRLIPPRFLRGLAVGSWRSILSEHEKLDLTSAILQFQERDPPTLINTGLALVAGWTEFGNLELPSSLVEPSIKMLWSSLAVRVDSTNWQCVLRACAAASAREVAEIAISAMTSPIPSRTVVDDVALEVLKELAAINPRLVMDVVGTKLIDGQSRRFFSICDFAGLFESIGIEQISRWLKVNGASHVSLIARHAESPYLDNEQPVISPLTEWILSEFEDNDAVFREFCAGRHSSEVRWGYARDQRAELEANLRPFENHRLRRVREWVEYELKLNKEDSRFDDYLDDMQERL